VEARLHVLPHRFGKKKKKAGGKVRKIEKKMCWRIL
jgi:hypothetical protein